MNFIEEKLQKALASVNAKLAEQGQADFVPEVAAILGSGLGDFADECVKTVATVSYNDIEGFPVSTISGHRVSSSSVTSAIPRSSSCRAASTSTRATP